METKQHVILVVEDEAPLMKVISTKLKQKGFKVLEANTVEKAMKHVEQDTIDFVWLDHYLPGETGAELVHKMKSSEQWATIPIFLVSNTASSDKIYAYLHLGVDAYHVKADKFLSDIIEEIELFLQIQ